MPEAMAPASSKTGAHEALVRDVFSKNGRCHGGIRLTAHSIRLIRLRNTSAIQPGITIPQTALFGTVLVGLAKQLFDRQLCQ